jgi:hypothetical protein
MPDEGKDTDTPLTPAGRWIIGVCIAVFVVASLAAMADAYLIGSVRE